MIKVICDGCGKDISADFDRYTAIIQLSSARYLDATIRKDVCEECKDKILRMLETQQLSFEDTGKNECE